MRITYAILVLATWCLGAYAARAQCKPGDKLGPMCESAGVCRLDEAVPRSTPLKYHDDMKFRRVTYSQFKSDLFGAASTLEGRLYLPSDNGAKCAAGPLPAVVWNHGSGCSLTSEEQDAPAQFFNRNCYIFFVPHREGHGMNRNKAGQYSVKQRTEAMKTLVHQLHGDKGEAIIEQQILALHEYYRWDVQQAVRFIRARNDVDHDAIFVAGRSYGGIQTVLAARDLPACLQAAVPLAPGAESWEHNPLLQVSLSLAVSTSQIPISLIQACGDHSLGPSQTLGPILDAKPAPNRSTIYDFCGACADEAHFDFGGGDGDLIGFWTHDVRDFLESVTEHSTNKCRFPLKQPSNPTLDGVLIIPSAQGC